MDEMKKTVEIIPLGAELDNTITFRLELLPKWLQLVSNEHAESYGTPPELWATAFLSGIAAATGKRFKLITGHYINYPQLWIMVVGTSGSGKSEAFRVAFKRLNEIDAQRYAQYQIEVQEWEQNEKRGNKPRWKQLCINDSTPEALFSVLKHSDNGLTLYRDELSGWFGDIGRYTKSGEVGHYLSIFDNSNFSINRKQENPQLITKPLLNIFGTIQPSVLGDVLTKNNAEGSGFAQRFLFLYPDFPPRKYQPATVQPTTYQSYEDVINSIVNLDGEAEASLSVEANKEYGLFFDKLEKERCKSNEFWSAVYAKAQIQVLRLALTIAVARSAETKINGEIGEKDMQCAIGMMRYFIQSLEKFKAEQGEPRRGKKELIKDIVRINPEASQRDIAQAVGVAQPYVHKVIRLSGITPRKSSQADGYRENSPITNEEETGDAPDMEVITPKAAHSFTANGLSTAITDNLITDNKKDLSTLPF